jgi:hypothetical protein
MGLRWGRRSGFEMGLRQVCVIWAAVEWNLLMSVAGMV